MKKYTLLLVTLATLVTGFVIYYNFFKPINTVEVKIVDFTQLRKSPKKLMTEEKDWYSLKLEYPENNMTVSDAIFSDLNAFANEFYLKRYKNFEEAAKELGLSSKDMKYTYSGEYETKESKDYFTYVYTIYTFTGGAHGSTIIKPITVGGNGAIVDVETILPLKNLEKISKLAEVEIWKQKKERMKEGGMSDKEINESVKNDTFVKEGVAPIRENYSSVWFDGDNLVISFGQYQVGPYSEGIYEVKIPRSELN